MSTVAVNIIAADRPDFKGDSPAASRRPLAVDSKPFLTQWVDTSESALCRRISRLVDARPDSCALFELPDFPGRRLTGDSHHRPTFGTFFQFAPHAVETPENAGTVGTANFDLHVASCQELKLRVSCRHARHSEPAGSGDCRRATENLGWRDFRRRRAAGILGQRDLWNRGCRRAVGIVDQRELRRRRLRGAVGFLQQRELWNRRRRRARRSLDRREVRSLWSQSRQACFTEIDRLLCRLACERRAAASRLPVA